jgi:hypothetical protein
VFCMFTGDTELLPRDLFNELIHTNRPRSARMGPQGFEP